VLSSGFIKLWKKKDAYKKNHASLKTLFRFDEWYQVAEYFIFCYNVQKLCVMCFWAGRWSIPGIHSLAASSYAERVNWQQVHTRNAWPGSKFIYGTHELAAGSYLERCAG
jgi:hypothetical protein